MLLDKNSFYNLFFLQQHALKLHAKMKINEREKIIMYQIQIINRFRLS